MYKVMGAYWQEGTALYYATRVQEFHWPGISEWLWESEFLLVLLSYATVIFQVSFPFLLLNRITKLIAVGCAVLFHGGIALFMGLIGFSWIMIGSELILLTDKDYRLIGAAARRAGAKAAGPLRLLRDRIASLPAVKGRQLIVFYDGWCPLCRASVASSRKLDWFSLIRFVSFREPGVIERYGLDADKVERRMHSTADGRRFAEGIDAVIQMATRLLPLWPAVPLLLFGPLDRHRSTGLRLHRRPAHDPPHRRMRRTLLPGGRKKGTGHPRQVKFRATFPGGDEGRSSDKLHQQPVHLVPLLPEGAVAAVQKRDQP